MVDLVDKGEAELQQLAQKVTIATSSSGTKATLWIGKKVGAAPFKAVVAVFRAIQQNANAQRKSGQVSLKEFTQIAEGKRELVNIDDAAVSKELERELRRHGVLWSVEAHRDGARTFHIRGVDAELIQHSLSIAAARVDEKLARNAPEIQAPSPDAAVTELVDEAPVFEQDQPDNITRLVDHGAAPYQHEEGGSPSYFVTIEQGDVRQTLWGVDLDRAVSVSGAEIGDGVNLENIGSVPITLPDGTKTHRNTWNVEVTESQQQVQQQKQAVVTREGGPSNLASEARNGHEPLIASSAQRPESTPADRTRAHVAEKIDKKVDQRKAEMQQSKVRSKKQTQSRHQADEAQQAPKVNRR